MNRLTGTFWNKERRNTEREEREISELMGAEEEMPEETGGGVTLTSRVMDGAERVAERAVEGLGRVAAQRVFALKTLPEPIAAQLAYFDKNGDGSIDVFELVEMVERFRAQDEVSDAIAGGGDDGENATEVSLKAFPGALKDVLASVYPHDASTGTIAVNPKATANHGGIGSALFHRREELEKMVHDLQTRMNRLVKIVSILLAASFIFTLGALFGLMVGADELIFKPEFKAAPDGTLFSVHSSLPARVFCSAIQ